MILGVVTEGPNLSSFLFAFPAYGLATGVFLEFKKKKKGINLA